MRSACRFKVTPMNSTNRASRGESEFLLESPVASSPDSCCKADVLACELSLLGWTAFSLLRLVMDSAEAEGTSLQPCLPETVDLGGSVSASPTAEPRLVLFIRESPSVCLPEIAVPTAIPRGGKQSVADEGLAEMSGLWRPLRTSAALFATIRMHPQFGWACRDRLITALWVIPRPKRTTIAREIGPLVSKQKTIPKKK